MNINPKNYDPKMHSAEHILNQTMVRMFNCGRAFSAHIEKKKSKCDYNIDRNLTEEEIVEIENRVNNIIEMNLDVRESFISRSEGETRFNLSKLPEEVGDTLGIITIGDYDACPCSGVHVNNTSEIGKFKIISTSNDNGFLRLRFKLE